MLSFEWVSKCRGIFRDLWERLSGVGGRGCGKVWPSSVMSGQVINVPSSSLFGEVVSPVGLYDYWGFKIELSPNTAAGLGKEWVLVSGASGPSVYIY